MLYSLLKTGPVNFQVYKQEFTNLLSGSNQVITNLQAVLLIVFYLRKASVSINQFRLVKGYGLACLASVKALPMHPAGQAWQAVKDCAGPFMMG